MASAALAILLAGMAVRSSVFAIAAEAKCETRQVALDEGYGVSAIAMREICD